MRPLLRLGLWSWIYTYKIRQRVGSISNLALHYTLLQKGMKMEQRCVDVVISILKKLIFVMLFIYFASKVIIAVDKFELQGS